MKRWKTRFEWMVYARCVENPDHTSECAPDSPEAAAAAEVCAECQVRPECISWALENQFCSVVVAGVHIPDPANKKEVRSAHTKLREILSVESRTEREI